MTADPHAIAAVEALAFRLEEGLTNRYPIGYCRGVKSALLLLRRGESIQAQIDEIRARTRNPIDGTPMDSSDPYDQGFLAGLTRAKAMVEGGPDG